MFLKSRFLLVRYFALASLFLSAPAAIAQRRKTTGFQNKPRLVVLLVVDQMRFDYLERFKPLFSKGGFSRLVQEGAVFANATHDHVPTHTAPGHADIATGSVPSLHGIVANSWFDRDRGRVVESVFDDTVEMIPTSNTDAGKLGAKKEGASPRSLKGETIGDMLRYSTASRSKVITMAVKDRSAILLGGKRPNGAYWTDHATGGFSTSTYYTRALPTWVANFNKSLSLDSYKGKTWTPLLPATSYATAQKENLSIQTSPVGPNFPHVFSTNTSEIPTQLVFSPFGNTLLLDFARAAIEGEELGADYDTDLLAVSFSVPDIVGHSYGPDSLEVQDIYARLDRDLESFFAYLSKKFKGNIIVALTSDHGVSPIPEYLSGIGLPGERYSKKSLRDAMQASLTARFGDGEYIQETDGNYIYLNHDLLRQKKIDHSEAEEVAGQAALSIPSIVGYYSATQFQKGLLPMHPHAKLFANGFFPNRSGDLILVSAPYALPEKSGTTTHGTPYRYDRHIPIIFAGPGIKRGTYFAEASASDIAPTLSALLKIAPPSLSIGRILGEGLN